MSARHCAREDRSRLLPVNRIKVARLGARHSCRTVRGAGTYSRSNVSRMPAAREVATGLTDELNLGVVAPFRPAHLRRHGGRGSHSRRLQCALGRRLLQIRADPGQLRRAAAGAGGCRYICRRAGGTRPASGARRTVRPLFRRFDPSQCTSFLGQVSGRLRICVLWTFHLSSLEAKPLRG